LNYAAHALSPKTLLMLWPKTIQKLPLKNSPKPRTQALFMKWKIQQLTWDQTGGVRIQIFQLHCTIYDIYYQVEKRRNGAGPGKKKKKRGSSSPNKLGKEFAVNFDAIRRRAGASNVVVAWELAIAALHVVQSLWPSLLHPPPTVWFSGERVYQHWIVDRKALRLKHRGKKILKCKYIKSSIIFIRKGHLQRNIITWSILGYSSADTTLKPSCGGILLPLPIQHSKDTRTSNLKTINKPLGWACL
jgi:hypothetical protein